MAAVSLRLCRVLRRGPGYRTRSARSGATRHALRRRFRASPYIPPREQRPDPAHRSRVPAQRTAGYRQGAVDRRDEGKLLTLGPALLTKRLAVDVVRARQRAYAGEPARDAR